MQLQFFRRFRAPKHLTSNSSQKPKNSTESVMGMVFVRTQELVVLLLLVVTAERRFADSQCGPTSQFCNPNAPFRTADGTCNNLVNPLFGASNIPFIRYLPAIYDPGNAPRTQGLPSPRQVSQNLSGGNKPSNPSDVTLMVMQWGQFLDHDFTLTPEAPDNGCCANGMTSGSTSPDCVPLDVTGDSFYSQFNVQCLRFVRSQPVPNSDPREQINSLTSFIDASMVYGSSLQQANSLREFVGGRLLVGPREGNPCPHVCPLSYPPIFNGSFTAGDVRAEEQPALTAMHAMFVRAHNDFVNGLAGNNPSFNDERLYQEGRRIVGALIQKITYDEFLPIILSQATINQHNLALISQSQGTYEEGYDCNINPSMANVFATAVYRFGHSLIKDQFVVADGTIVELSENFLRHDATIPPNPVPSSFIRGLVRDFSERMDQCLVDAVRNKLFAEAPFDHGSDLFARNIMRGRDHGLPPYNSWRQLCGLPLITSFNDLTNFMPASAATALQSSYASVDDIELFPAGISEFPATGALVGPTFDCILGKYFHDLKFGDRFWFEGSPNIHPHPLTVAQMNSILDTRLSTLICAYTRTTSIQDSVMLPSSSQQNGIQDCDQILQFGIVNDITTSIWSI